MTTHGQGKTRSRALPGRVLIAGKSTYYANAAIPTTPDGTPIVPLSAAKCPQCGHAYSSRMHHPKGKCEECRLEDSALSYAAALFAEAQGTCRNGKEHFYRMLQGRESRLGAGHNRPRRLAVIEQ